MSTTQVKQQLKKYLPRSVVEALMSLKDLGVRKIPNADVYIRRVAGKKGIEIGGPSKLFKTALPVYQEIHTLDGVNFCTDTVWERKLQPGLNFNFDGGRTGVQFICDATDLSQIGDGTYDFVLSSNCLEHVANPLKALVEWKRVMNDGGSLILVLPNRESNFDRNRPVTPFQHILEDYLNDTTEHDLTHLDEILKLHDLSMDLPAGDFENFRNRSLRNYENRTLHHHVFDSSVIESMLGYAGFDVAQSNKTKSDFFTLATKRSQIE